MKRKRIAVFFALFFSNMSTNIASPWSVFYPALVRDCGWKPSEVSVTFSVMLISAFIGNLTAAHFKRKVSPGVLLLWGGLMMGAGWALASILLRLWSLYMLVGFSSGFGAGLILNTITSEIPRWFPEQKGFVIGSVSSSGALAGIFFAPVGAALISTFGIRTAMKLLGGFYFLMVLPGVIILKRRMERETTERPLVSPNIRSILTNPAFLTLWFFLLMHATAGTFVSSQNSAFMQRIWNYTEMEGAQVASLYAAATLVGRIFAGKCSDSFRRDKVLICMSVGLGGTFAIMVCAESARLFSVAAILSGMCFGGFMTVMPALCSDYFGNQGFSKGWGMMYSAYTLSSLFGPVAASFIERNSSQYYLVLAGFLGIIILALLVFIYKVFRKEE